MFLTSGLFARLLLRRKKSKIVKGLCVYYRLSKCKYKCGMPYDNGQRIRAIETESPM